MSKKYAEMEVAKDEFLRKLADSGLTVNQASSLLYGMWYDFKDTHRQLAEKIELSDILAKYAIGNPADHA